MICLRITSVDLGDVRACQISLLETRDLPRVIWLQENSEDPATEPQLQVTRRPDGPKNYSRRRNGCQEMLQSRNTVIAAQLIGLCRSNILCSGVLVSGMTMKMTRRREGGRNEGDVSGDASTDTFDPAIMAGLRVAWE
ncbi:hypothetical protein Tco_1372180, partial [Tanacetum coccineum]